ncbi:hypothetical protein L6164_027462 [Bauhinia variegata]|uniref:Uncharacterized protein n=1 Tax=Bauhinia variegata TaxID=167791 RepID=A0ACB9LU26_BAUVA|nr:hypothetical protein L6164_027462 [Bauhinia variegata]
MDLLSISPSYLSASFSSRRLSLSLSKQSHSSFSPQISISSGSHPPRTLFRCALTTSQKPSRDLNFNPESQNPNFNIRFSSPQSPAAAMRGAEADAMGLLLRERIVYLGSNIDDFVADAIISQLLLLDAQDSTKDIRLFINSAGGSLR